VSLQRRIAAAVALGVTLVVAVLSVIEYASVRSHLRGEIDSTLTVRSQGYLQRHGGGPEGPGGPPGGGFPDGGGRPPDRQPQDAFGGATGRVQIVNPDGSVSVPGGGTAIVPVTARAKAVAQSGRGRYYSDVTVKGHHLRVLTVADPIDHHAIQVELPLTQVDRELDQLLVVFLIAIVAGILVAAALGGLIGRAALAPIGRFTRRTETVSDRLDGSQRLEEGGPTELARLAASFNRTLEALERSVQAQRHLVADASHELRTPIAALRSNIQIFLDSGRLPLAERESLQSAIVAELDELTQLVADVLELARGSGPGEAADEVRLDVVVHDAIERTQRRAPDLEWEIELEPTTIEHDHDRVGRAVINVLDNARKWSPPGGRIEVRLAGGTLTVRDHGPGFGDDDLPHVFDRFYRAPGARKMPGSGLGLAIARQAAESRGGVVRAENHPDGGAVVSVRFAASAAGATRAPSPRRSAVELHGP
jgi:two-component system sensor histidine kinase MprB